MDTITTFVTWFPLIYLGWTIGIYILEKIFNAMLRNLPVGDDPDEDNNEPLILEIAAKVECYNNCLYAYSLDDGQFLGQGKDRETLIARLNENLENTRLIIAEADGAEFVRPID